MNKKDIERNVSDEINVFICHTIPVFRLQIYFRDKISTSTSRHSLRFTRINHHVKSKHEKHNYYVRPQMRLMRVAINI